MVALLATAILSSGSCDLELTIASPQRATFAKGSYPVETSTVTILTSCEENKEYKINSIQQNSVLLPHRSCLDSSPKELPPV